MLKIRLQRVGRIHQPAFRLVLTESANSTKSGRFKEVLGSYDPRKTAEVLKADRIKYWLGKGVTPTPSVWNLLIKKGVVKGKKVHVSADAKPQAVAAAPEVAEPEQAEVPVESAPEAEAVPEAEAPAPEAPAE
jgi:small subunit ribosomal protein S16